MADKRISQLIERVDIANNDVLPIVASGATTTNKVTVSTLQDWMQDNLDVGVTSVGLTMPSAFQVSGSPITTSGNITVTATGTASQYIRGDGTLADFPQGGGGGGASVSYYLNGSVSQGTIGGVAYLEMNKTPILGAGTDFTIATNGYIASFITDAGDPGLLEIPGGNWNFETYFQASSGGGTPSFYVELYKVDSGGTATLIASNSSNPELIAFGTTTTAYFSTLAVSTTTLAITDRLAIRYYVTNAGRTITLHTENSNLCQIITTFTTGLTALNGLTAQVQNFATGTSGTDFNISSTGSIHTFNLPDASASNRGAVTTGTQTFAGYKIFNGTIGVNNDIQLATQGTALNTFIKNINSTGLTSIGSNGFGFNNANNIYFSGSSKGGGVFAFSNTGTQIYTLPNASGTISLTSDLGAYLPLSGGTMTGAINGISANFTSNLSSDSGVYSNTAFFAKHNPGSTVTVNGWNAMQGDANTFIVLNSTKGMRINFPSNASFTHTLPDASGTIALTSNLSSYLPLSGGTLTGALNGTSAVFSGGFEAGKTGGAVTSGDLLVDPTSLSANVYVGRLSSTSNDNTNFIVRNRIGTELFKVTGNTGAATFSSSVTASSVISASATFSNFGSETSAVVGFGDSNTGFFRPAANSLSITTNGVQRQIINSDGAMGFNYPILGSRSFVFRTISGRPLTLETIAPTGIHSLYLRPNDSGRHLISSNYLSGGVYLPLALSGRENDADFVLSTSGNVGIGTPTPGARLEVKQGSSEIPMIIDSSSISNGAYTQYQVGDSSGWEVGMGGSGESYSYLFSYGTFGTANSKVAITNAGRVGIGTTSPNVALHISGVNEASGFDITNTTASTGKTFRIASQSTGNLVFEDITASTERMRITSGGFLKASNTGSYIGVSNSWHEFNNNTSGSVVLYLRSHGASNGSGILVTTPAADSSEYFFGGNSDGVSRVRIFTNGNIQNQNNSYGSLSDIKLKENIEDATPKLDDLMKVKVRNYNLIGDDKKQIGVIAQELEEVFPAMIDESEDFEEVEVPQVDEEGNEILNEEGEVVTTNERVSKGTTTKSVKYSVFVPMLIKAMQEQQEQIKSLTEQIEALKSQING